MKRASKILTLILIVVFVLSVFAGCDLVGRNTAKYRATVAMTVGDQQITIGKLLDTFNSYYNNYYYYISAGYLTADSLLEMVMNSLLQQYVQVDDYVHNHSTVREANGIKNAEYLTAEQFAYCIKYVKHTSFTTFDGTVLKSLSVKHDIGDAKTEDTSRDFAEYDELLSQTSYAEHHLMENFVSKDADEYFDKYYKDANINFASFENLVGDYVYTDTTKAAAQTIIDELNERIEDDSDEITFDEYVEAQQKAIDQYSDTVKNNYGITLQEFMEAQVADMVTSCILALWSYEKYSKLDITKDIDSTNKILAQDQAAKFKINGDFNSFITGLNNSSFIYGVPNDMQGKYVFVKNILIPFTSQQSASLSAQADGYGGTDTPAYKKMRNELATKIAAEYFDSDKYDADIEKIFTDTGLLKEDTDEDAERKYEKLTGLFTTDSEGNIAIDEAGILGNFFGSNNKVITMGELDEAETIVELMKRFNTDVGQHSNRYDYVVYVGEDWKDYKHSWVEEFYTAVNMLKPEGKGEFARENLKKYVMCVSTYGVHIIYIDSFVEDHIYDYKDVDWANAWKATEKLDYVRYKAEFDKQANKAAKDALKEIEDKYIGEKSDIVTVNKQFKKFLKHNNFTFDFENFLKIARQNGLA